MSRLGVLRINRDFFVALFDAIVVAFRVTNRNESKLESLNRFLARNIFRPITRQINIRPPPCILIASSPCDAVVSFVERACGATIRRRELRELWLQRKLRELQKAPGYGRTKPKPAAGVCLRAGDREVGRVTSAVWSWRFGCVLALAYVRREHLAPGTALVVGEAPGTSATVRALPF